MNEACTPNISPRGIARRKRGAVGAALITVALFAALAIMDVAWPVRLIVFLPAAAGAVGWFQARRNTCVARARQGTFEHDDFSTTPAAPADVAASRRVASGILRDAVLVGLAAAAAGAASAFI